MAQDDNYDDDQAAQPNPFDEQDKGSYFNPRQDGPRLPGDFERTPAADPDDVDEDLSKADPRTDSGLDSDEEYDEGLTGATDADAEEDDNDHDQPERIA